MRTRLRRRPPSSLIKEPTRILAMSPTPCQCALIPATLIEDLLATSLESYDDYCAAYNKITANTTARRGAKHCESHLRQIASHSGIVERGVDYDDLAARVSRIASHASCLRSFAGEFVDWFTDLTRSIWGLRC